MWAVIIGPLIAEESSEESSTFKILFWFFWLAISGHYLLPRPSHVTSLSLLSWLSLSLSLSFSLCLSVCLYLSRSLARSLALSLPLYQLESGNNHLLPHTTSNREILNQREKTCFISEHPRLGQRSETTRPSESVHVHKCVCVCLTKMCACICVCVCVCVCVQVFKKVCASVCGFECLWLYFD